MNSTVRYPDIPLFLQDYIDVAYIMQKHVFPNKEYLSTFTATFSQRTKFFGVDREYDAVITDLMQKPDFFIRMRLKASSYSRNRQKAMFFAVHAVNQMQCFSGPIAGDSYYPNRIDLSIFDNLPPERMKKASILLKKLFTINEYGNLIYRPEMIFQNHFATFRDHRMAGYTNSEV